MAQARYKKGLALGESAVYRICIQGTLDTSMSERKSWRPGEIELVK